jgi:hypothetical protein
MSFAITKSVTGRTDNMSKLLLSEIEEFVAAAREIGCVLDDVVSFSNNGGSVFEMEIHP